MANPLLRQYEPAVQTTGADEFRGQNEPAGHSCRSEPGSQKKRSGHGPEPAADVEPTGHHAPSLHKPSPVFETLPTGQKWLAIQSGGGTDVRPATQNEPAGHAICCADEAPVGQ